jgi:hypothetical protein
MTYSQKVIDFILACQVLGMSGEKTKTALARRGIPDITLDTIYVLRKKASDQLYASALVERQVADIEKSFKGKDKEMSECRCRFRQGVIQIIYERSSKSTVTAEITNNTPKQIDTAEFSKKQLQNIQKQIEDIQPDEM